MQQQGSLVCAEKLRFDFAHFKDVTKNEIARIEELVNGYITNNHILSIKQMPLSVAKRTGALAFFAEKYEGKVRVVSIEIFPKSFAGELILIQPAQSEYLK